MNIARVVYMKNVYNMLSNEMFNYLYIDLMNIKMYFVVEGMEYYKNQ